MYIYILCSYTDPLGKYLEDCNPRGKKGKAQLLSKIEGLKLRKHCQNILTTPGPKSLKGFVPKPQNPKASKSSFPLAHVTQHAD